MHFGDRQAIRALGEQTGKPIPEVSTEDFDLFNNGYVLDASGRVCRLRLDGRGLGHMNHLKTLTALTVLDLKNNQIREINGLEDLTALTVLCMGSNQIQTISGLETLTALTSLDLGKNKIREISGLETLAALTWLDLRNNQIQELKGLETLTALTEIGLNNNQIKDISGLKTLTGLTTILLRNNRLVSLPKWLADLGSDWTLDLDLRQICIGDNPLESPPPEIIRQGMEVIRAFYNDLKNRGSTPVL